MNHHISHLWLTDPKRIHRLTAEPQSRTGDIIAALSLLALFIMGLAAVGAFQ